MEVSAILISVRSKFIAVATSESSKTRVPQISPGGDVHEKGPLSSGTLGQDLHGPLDHLQLQRSEGARDRQEPGQSSRVDAARSEVEIASATVQEREAEVQEAQQRLSEARVALKKAQQTVAARKATVDKSATDAVLFRTVQKQLLRDEKLQDVAISASVVNGTVTLTGNVADAAQRDLAIELARTTPGVANVESRIRVPVAPPKQKEK